MISGVERQVDVLIDARVQEDVTQRVIIDAKYRQRPLDVKDVESFEGMMKDCRAQRGVLVCSNGYSSAALRRAQDVITISLITPEEMESVDFSVWDPCLGSCNPSHRQRARPGWVLYDQPLELVLGGLPSAVLVIGKCDGCSDFHVWCWECGAHFAIVGNEAEYKCSCDRFWLTAVEPEGTDELGNELSSVLLLLVPLVYGTKTLVVDRRPLR